MGEAWGDLTAAEYLFENGLPRAGRHAVRHRRATSPATTSTGIRDYDGSRSPLNFSDLGFDLVGPGGARRRRDLGRDQPAGPRGVGASGTARHARRCSSSCADGLVAVDACPGNRRWVQLMFDSFLLQAASQVSMLDMRDNMLAADLVRFGGANQDMIWNAFAAVRHGPGRGRAARSDTDPTPSFASPFANNATVTLRPLSATRPDARGPAVRRRLRGAGRPGRRHRPGRPPCPDTFQIVPASRSRSRRSGPASAPHGSPARSCPGATQDLRLDLPRNLASTAAGRGRSPVTASTSTSSPTTPRRPTGRRWTAWPASRSPSTWPATRRSR